MHCTCVHHSLQLFFFHFPSDLLSLKSHRSAPLPRTIITLVCDPRWVAGREMNSQVGLQGLEYYFVRTNTACSSPHSFTSSDWCWQFPQTKLCHSKTWSMALISQILTSIRPRSNLFLPRTKNFWCPYSTQSSSRTTFFYRNTFAASSMYNACRCSIYIQSKWQFQLVKWEHLNFLFRAWAEHLDSVTMWAVWQSCTMCGPWFLWLSITY